MKRQKTTGIIVLLAVLVCVLAVGTWYFRKQRSEKVSATERQAETQQSETTDELERLLWNKIKLNGKKYKYSTDYETYLVIGTDGSGKEDADRDEYIGNMADFLMLVIVNRKEQTYAFLQLNRDTMTEIGYLKRDGEKLYLPEIIRHALGFRYEKGARPRVLSLLLKH